MTTLELHYANTLEQSFGSSENCIEQVSRDRRYSGACSHKIPCS